MMGRSFASMKHFLACIIYRNMYGDNFGEIGDEVQKISDRMSDVNKRALAIAVNTRITENNLGQYCLVHIETPVSKADSTLNKKALMIAEKMPTS